MGCLSADPELLCLADIPPALNTCLLGCVIVQTTELLKHPDRHYELLPLLEEALPLLAAPLQHLQTSSRTSQPADTQQQQQQQGAGQLSGDQQQQLEQHMQAVWQGLLAALSRALAACAAVGAADRAAAASASLACGSSVLTGAVAAVAAAVPPAAAGGVAALAAGSGGGGGAVCLGPAYHQPADAGPQVRGLHQATDSGDCVCDNARHCTQLCVAYLQRCGLGHSVIALLCWKLARARPCVSWLCAVFVAVGSTPPLPHGWRPA